MPRREDIHTVLIIGSGPIVIGQAAEFDYSGTQACKALKEEGYRVVLVNSNPATIMTDPDFADATYLEPLTVPFLEQIIAREKPDALLPTLGGQTALNLAVALAEAGVLEKHGVKLIGANLEAIRAAEDRQLFKDLMQKAGLELPRSGVATTVEEAREIVRSTGLPAVLRPSFTLGGTGGGIAHTAAELDEMVRYALSVSPTHSVLIEESVIGWKEYELEVMRDRKDNVVIICSIENVDPMGVHTGDSITVAPALTLTDREYQRMRDGAIRCIRAIGVETGGSNVQFGVNPRDGRMVIIEMNPRVSRSSALASKATGFAIARIAAKLAVGYTLDEIPNAIVNPEAKGGRRGVSRSEDTPSPRAAFEPTIDYVVVKAPRFAFEKFPGARPELTTSMKSVGEAMSMGRTFKEAFQKVLRSLEVGSYGLETDREHRRDARLAGAFPVRDDELESCLRRPNPERTWLLARAFTQGMTVARAHELTGIDPWFLAELKAIVAEEAALRGRALSSFSAEELRHIKSHGFSDRRLGEVCGGGEDAVRARRWELGVHPQFKRVDTCAAEFEAQTPYLYSTYETPMYRAGKPVDGSEAFPTARRKIAILGGGPIRIGQGIEFDYCCVHASMALQKMGIEVLMLNCNPETVSTDHDTSDRLYFEPLTLEDVLEILRVEQPEGVLVQFGGQTPLKLARALLSNGVKILGTSADAIDRAEDRKRSAELVDKLGLKQPPSGTAHTLEQARVLAARLGYPLMVRPSYVLGGRAMEIVYDEKGLDRYVGAALDASPEHPVLVDRFLSSAIELDVDVLADGHEAIVAGVMEHVEEAGIHSGDSACAIPPFSLPADIIDEVRRQARALAMELGVVGLMNAQFAVQGRDVFVIEVNPRASRTIPFVGKAVGLQLPQLAAQVMAGRTLRELGVKEPRPRGVVSVKESVFPFLRFPGVDTILGPEMKSTGEVMAMADDFAGAFLKSQLAAGQVIPPTGTVFISVRDEDKPVAVKVARALHGAGYAIMATRGTHRVIEAAGVPCTVVNKVREGGHHTVDAIRAGQIAMVVNTTSGPADQVDSFTLRREALQRGVAYFTTARAAEALAQSMAGRSGEVPRVRRLQDLPPVG
ncbi:MAG: carbamoyl-phosphate synthase large subunit [Deltaproteobacteria bacterium]|nr:carbamoyl-phosphate synthase large subunit [Deltaproteobacteria bacterium]